MWTGTVLAASYGDGQDVRFPNVLSAAQLAELAQQKIEEQLAAVGETRRHEVHLQHRAGTMRLPAGEVTAVVAFSGLCTLTGALLSDVFVAIVDPRVRVS